MLAAVVIVAAIIHRRKFWRPDKRWLVPLTLSCMLLTLLALSTKITFGSATVIDLDPSGKLSPYFSPLRASGRLFWAPYYAILAAILVAPFLLFRKTWANLLIAAMLILQFADTSALRHWVHTTISEDHPSPSEVAHLVAVGSAASEPDCAAGMAMRARRLARWSRRLSDFRIPCRRAEDANQQLSVGALHRSGAGLRVLAGGRSDRAARTLAGFGLRRHAGRCRCRRARSDRAGKMS